MTQFHCGQCDVVNEGVAEPRAVLLCTTASTSLSKLKGTLSRHRLPVSEPGPKTVLIAGDAWRLEQFLGQLRDSLSSAELNDVRGTFFAAAAPASEELAQGRHNLTGLECLLTHIQTRWLVKILQTDALFSVFQPLVSLAEKRIVAYESLLRGRLNGEVIGAERLLVTARLMGLSSAMEMAARRISILRGRELLDQGHKLFVNFEPNAIQNPKTCLADMEATCRQVGATMEQLVFEVVETEEVKDLAYLKAMTDEYRSKGAMVALDDLGSGYSSFRYLVELHPDYIKLDRHLVHGAYRDRTRSVLLRAITAAARELGIGVIAEGVETAEDLQFCIEAGVDFAQGYFLARPAEIPPPISAAAMQMLLAGGAVPPEVAMQRQTDGVAARFETLQQEDWPEGK